MAKRNKKKNPDKETLEHYTSYNEQDVPANIPKPSVDSSKDSAPTFIKAELSVDKIMSKRKNAVINKPPSEKK